MVAFPCGFPLATPPKSTLKPLHSPTPPPPCPKKDGGAKGLAPASPGHLSRPHRTSARSSRLSAFRLTPPRPLAEGWLLFCLARARSLALAYTRPGLKPRLKQQVCACLRSWGVGEESQASKPASKQATSEQASQPTNAHASAKQYAPCSPSEGDKASCLRNCNLERKEQPGKLVGCQETRHLSDQHLDREAAAPTIYSEALQLPESAVRHRRPKSQSPYPPAVATVFAKRDP